jgi:Outer membrane protein beta-barrel domain
MKRKLLTIVLALISMTIWAQENMFSLSGGYVFTNVEEADANANGFRINGLFEFNPQGGPWAHGVSFGYINTKATTTGIESNDYAFTNLPLYFSPKYLIGKKSFKGFVKGAVGMHFSHLSRTGTLAEISDWSIGFYGGASAGVMKTFNDKIFINLEYEWAYLSNANYRDGFINTVMGGIGMKF